MNKGIVELLEKHFDTAFAAPDGVKKLRKLILSLAMQGKLVNQDPKDQPASELLKEIEAEKRRLVKEGKVKAPKPLPEIKAEEVPYQLPEGWEWVRLPDCYYGVGNKGNQIQTKDYLESGLFPVIDQGKAFVSAYYDGKDKLLEIDRPVLVFGDHTKNIKFVDFNFVIGADGVKVLCSYDGIFPRFLYRLIQSYDLADRGYARHFKVLNEKLVPLPPTPEQHRIVAKIDQLMARCDELEKLRAEHEQKRLAVHTAALNRLLAAQERDSFAEAWQFITRHFGRLYSVKENVAELRKTILQLAVMGKLVPQDPNDPPASTLLKEIEAEKQRLVKEGKIKKAKPLPEIKPKEAPYRLPEGWEWVRLGFISEFINGDRGKNYPNKEEYVSEGIPWINTGHIERDGTLTLSEMNFITRDKFNSLRGGKIQKGDLVYCLRGATFGKTAIVDPYDEGAIASSLMIIRPVEPVSKEFIYRYLVSPTGRSQIFRFDNGSAQPNLSANSVRLYTFPLPPLPEQQRIVAKIDQLMTLCDQLEKQIYATAGKQTDLLNAVMVQV